MADAKAAGEKFLAENAKKPGVVVRPSGLQYKVLKDGTGKSPAKSSIVTTHYRGTLINGTEFDSSYSRNAPASFGVGQVIAGWTEALQLMKEGSKWELYLPSNLAYGAHGAGPDIGPNEALIFEVELLKVQ
jgi:FKBP-type peptidyl-prolyl cis-trans isomerase FklB